jgi:hypothetical protein
LAEFTSKKHSATGQEDIANEVNDCKRLILKHLMLGRSIFFPNKEAKPMITYIIISIISGILFGLLDGVINANPLAQKLYAVYRPIAKTSINPLAGIVIDIVYGFVMAGIFLLLYNSLPGEIGIIKGMSYAVLVWFFRVLMNVTSQWVMYTVPVQTLLYSLVAGLGEMLILGALYGLTLKPVI